MAQITVPLMQADIHQLKGYDGDVDTIIDLLASYWDRGNDLLNDPVANMVVHIDEEDNCLHLDIKCVFSLDQAPEFKKRIERLLN